MWSTGSGRREPFRDAGPQLTGPFIVAALAGIVAAALPARRAGRIDVLQALESSDTSYEGAGPSATVAGLRLPAERSSSLPPRRFAAAGVIVGSRTSPERRPR